MSKQFFIPTQADTKLSQQSSQILATHRTSISPQHIRIVAQDGSEQDLLIPAGAFHLLRDILKQTAQGNAVTLSQAQPELALIEAAEFLGISESSINQLIETGKIPCNFDRDSPYIHLHALVQYLHQNEIDRHNALDEMVTISQNLDLYE